MINHKSFGTKEQKAASLALDLYEGHQKTHLIKQLDGLWENGSGERNDWRSRGIYPIVRNITASIIDKSGLLFNHEPVMKTRTDDGLVDDAVLINLLESASFLEFMQNCDVQTRLLKASVVLAQRYIPNETSTINGAYKYDATLGEGLKLILLNPSNCVVEKDPMDNITSLGYLIDTPAECTHPKAHDKSSWCYRLITPDLIQDILVVAGTGIDKAVETIIFEEVNVDGIVPATIFYDTTRPPYQRMFPVLDESLTNLQLFYNVSLTDLGFSMAWSVSSTLFTDSEIVSSDNKPMPSTGASDAPYSHEAAQRGPNVAQRSEQSVGGLGSVVHLEKDGNGGTPMVKFLSPDTKFQPIADVLDKLVKNIASDYSVNLKTADDAKAASGIALIIEEVQNLNLREKRAKYFESGLKQLHRVLQVLYPADIIPGDLEVTFAPPSLPVDPAAELNQYQQMMNVGLASRVDYFMEVKGMTREEAEAKILEIDSYKPKVETPVIPTVEPEPDTIEVTEDEDV